VAGSNPRIDYSRKMIDEVNSFMRQATREKVAYDDSVSRLLEMFRAGEDA